MLRIHLLQQWYALSDSVMEEALHEIASMRLFARLSGLDAIPDETTILNFRRSMETHGLAAKMLEAVNAHLARKGQSLRAGTIVDATIISAPSSTKNADKARDPEIHQTKKDNQWYFGMKAHIGVDEFSGLVHHVKCTAANVGDVTVTHELLRGSEDCVLGDSGYTGADTRAELRNCKATLLIAKNRGKVKAIKNARDRRQYERWESCKASMRAKVEHPFRVIKRQFGYTKVRYRGGQEYCSSADPVRAVQFVDDAPAADAGPGINPSGGALWHLQKRQNIANLRYQSVVDRAWPENSGLNAGCSEHP
jgi:IS5 family transposase